jgi:stage II sporulation protein R
VERRFIMHKRRMLLLLLLGLFLTVIGLGGRYLDRSSLDLIGDNCSLVRLHVVANSNSAEDQQLKLQVRDAILAEISPEFEDLTNASQARGLIVNNIKKIQELVEKEISRRGYNYPAHVELGRFNFPTKQYGEIVYPAGEYEALRVIIGTGQGNNWWCVLFPPLCFVDITNSIAVGTPTIEQNQSPDETRPEIEYKFKLAEMLKR